MNIHTECEQGSLEWYLLRSGRVTASEMDRLVTPLGKVKTGDGPKTLLMEKLAEKWLGGPLPAVEGVWDLEQGHFLEEYARPAFELETGLTVKKVAFVTGDNENIGCSPDGLIGDSCGLELKSPHVEKHIRYLLDGEVPQDYILQVQGCMLVTGYSHWYFCSFRRNMPLFILDVQRDEKIQAALSEALDRFLVQLEDGWKMLCEKNGGPPAPRSYPTLSKSPIKMSWEHEPGDDIVP